MLDLERIVLRRGRKLREQARRAREDEKWFKEGHWKKWVFIPLAFFLLVLLLGIFSGEGGRSANPYRSPADRQRDQRERDGYDQAIKDIGGQRVYEEGKKYPDLFEEKYRIPAPGKGQLHSK